jgi:menaquinone-dependent protoporphyrinogen oxidase
MGTQVASPPPPHRVLVAFGSQRGGTEGIAKIIGETLRGHGLEVDVAPTTKIHALRGYDAAIVGGAVYANRWHTGARRFVSHHVSALRRMPVWTFSSGPLDDSADRDPIAPPTQVAVLRERIGALGHVTFGGRLAKDAQGFPAREMAKTSAGDWRNPARIRAWAEDVARELPEAHPGPAVDHPARSWMRLLVHAGAAAVIVGALSAGLLEIVRPGVAFALHTFVAPLTLAAMAAQYFMLRGAREPLPAALVFGAALLVMDLAIGAAVATRGVLTVTNLVAATLALVLAVAGTGAVGFILSTMPWPKPPAKPRS